MKKSLRVASTWIVVITIAWLIINLIHIVWYYMRPEGFWGFCYFLKIVVLFVPGVFLFLAIGVLLIYSLGSLLRDFPRNFNWRRILLGLANIVLVLLIFTFNIFQTQFFELSLFKMLADKYRDLKVSEEYISRREFSKALESAITAKEMAFEDRTPLSIFVLTRMYSNSSDARRLRADEEFSAMINYAYCLSQFDSLLRQSIHSYESALKIAQNPLLSSKPGYKVFPLSALVQLNISEGNLDRADLYSIELFEQVARAEREDILYFIQSQEIIAYEALSVGDQKTASSIFISNLETYVNGGLDKSKSIYLHFLLNAVSGSLYRNDLSNAALLLEEGEELANKRKSKDIYLDFLGAKIKFCGIAAAQGFDRDVLLKTGFFKSFTNFFVEKRKLSEKFEEKVVETYLELIEKVKGRFGDESIEYIKCLSQFATYLAEHSRSKEADILYEKILSFKKILVDADPEMLDRIELKRSLFLLSQPGRRISNSQISKIEDQVYDKAANRLVFLPENERESYASIIQKNIHDINSVLLSNPTKSSLPKLYDNILASKNILLYTNRYIRKVLLDSGNVLLQKEYAKIQQESRLGTGRDFNIQIREKKLMRRLRKSPGFTQYNPRQINWRNVRDALGPKTLAVEYLVVPDMSLVTKPNTYYALVIDRQAELPRLYKLCTEDSLSKLLNRGGNLKQSTDSIYTQMQPIIRQIFLDPFLDDSRSTKSLKLSLSGMLHFISFPAVLEGSGLDFEILGSTRLLVDSVQSAKGNKHATIFGDIEYGAFDESDNKQAPLSRSGFGQLPFSAREVSDVKLLLESSKYSTQLFRGKQATVQRFFELSGQKNAIIHLATHGIYDQVPRKIRASKSESSKIFQTDDALAKCELVFAGANQQRSTSRIGIVTALEVSRLDLSRTELVVLSSCESGLGDLRDFEGVQGFQRAFTLAGVENTLVSLWSVSDEHTAELMKYFYTNLLSGMNKHDALLLAQSKMRKIYKDPYYWAGFVLIRG
jgi:hypothetical protein